MTARSVTGDWLTLPTALQMLLQPTAAWPPPHLCTLGLDLGYAPGAYVAATPRLLWAAVVRCAPTLRDLRLRVYDGTLSTGGTHGAAPALLRCTALTALRLNPVPGRYDAAGLVRALAGGGDDPPPLPRLQRLEIRPPHHCWTTSDPETTTAGAVSQSGGVRELAVPLTCTLEVPTTVRVLSLALDAEHFSGGQTYDVPAAQQRCREQVSNALPRLSSLSIADYCHSAGRTAFFVAPVLAAVHAGDGGGALPGLRTLRISTGAPRRHLAGMPPLPLARACPGLRHLEVHTTRAEPGRDVVDLSPPPAALVHRAVTRVLIHRLSRWQSLGGGGSTPA